VITGGKPAALVLAAGRGTRFGGAKMLADVNGRPMLQHVLDLAAAADLNPVVVVLGDDADTVEAAVEWRKELRVRNPEPDRGLSSSLAIGLGAIGQGERVVVLLGDQPFLKWDQVDRIIAAERDPARPIVVPRYEDSRPGNPVLLEREAWPLVRDLVGDQGMVQVIWSKPHLVRYVDVPGTNPDIDTPAELARESR
jgi:molybdenum cofactor cytidylyltransferase